MGAITREVTLKINVTDDRQVDKAEASMKRLKKAADDLNKPASGGGRDGAIEAAAKRLGISYDEMAAKVKAASGATKEASAAIAEVGQVAAGSAGGLGRLGTVAGPVGAAITAITLVIGALVVAAYKLGQEIFSIAEGFAKYASEIKKAQEATGLALDTVVGLQYETEATGRSFESVAGAVNKFREQIGKAAAGSEDARRSLALLGIDGKKALTDIDGAFKTAVTAIAKAKDPFDQVRLAAAAFGSEGVKLIPFIRQFGGDVDALKRKAEELGLQIGGKNVQQADAFNRAYTDLKKVVQGIANTFGSEFLPKVTDVLREFGNWLVNNKAEIKDWAMWAAEWIEYAINRWREFFKFLDRSREASQSYDLTYAPDGTMIPVPKNAQQGPLGGAPIDANKVYGTPTTILPPGSGTADPQAMVAKLQEQERKRKEAMEESARRAKALADLIRDLEQRNINFGDTTEVTATRVRLLSMGIKDLNSGLALYALQVAAGIDKKKKDAEADKERKKALEDYQKALASETKQVSAAGFGSVVDAQTQLNELSQQVQLGRELNVIEKSQAQYQGDRLKYTRQLIDAGFKVDDIDQLLAIKDAEQERVEAILKQIQAKKDLIAQQEKERRLQEQFKDYTAALEDQITVLARGGQELTVFERVQRDIARTYKDWTDAQKQNALELANQIDLLEELNRQHAELKDFFGETLRYAFEGDFGGLVANFRRNVADAISDRLSDFLATSVLGFDPKATDNPVAKPIVGKLDITNKLLSQLVKSTGQMPAASGLGSLGGLPGGLFNGGGAFGGGGTGPGGTPFFNPVSTQGSGISNTLQLPGGRIFNTGRGGNGIWSNLKQLFSTGEGGIFAPRQTVGGGTSRMAGILGGIGDLAALAGGIIGGRVGGVLSSAGAGASFGAMFGPWGAAIGAGIGALFGLFGGDPKRKRDKNEKIPALNKGFTDALGELRKILEDLRFLRVEPDEAVARAEAVRSEMAGGFGIQFESNKYRKQARETISRRLSEADAIIAQIKEAAGIARGAADRRQRILPEFAGGIYLSDYFRPNGLLPGAFDARDNIFAMISRGEMVLNPRQQNRVRNLAGFDVFASAGIPNYPNPSQTPKLAGGGIAGVGLATAAQNIVLQPNFTLVVQGVTFENGARAWVESDDGRRTVVKMINEETKFRAR